jgi:hypothetical protein
MASAMSMPKPRVLAAVEAVLSRGKQISMLEYFDGAIKDRHAKEPASPDIRVAATNVFVEQGDHVMIRGG